MKLCGDGQWVSGDSAAASHLGVGYLQLRGRSESLWVMSEGDVGALYFFFDLSELEKVGGGEGGYEEQQRRRCFNSWPPSLPPAALSHLRHGPHKTVY